MVAQHREDGRQRQAAPGHDEHRAGQHPRPARRHQIEDIAGDGEQREEDQRRASAEAVREPAARVGIDGVEQLTKGPIEGHPPRSGPEHLQILGHEAHPQLLAHPQDEECGEHRNDVALQPQGGAEAGEWRSGGGEHEGDCNTCC